MKAESLPSLKLRVLRRPHWKLTLPSAAETPGMRMPQVEKKLALGKLWTREGELGKDETKNR